MKVRIMHDVYKISKRIKQIDKNYFIVYNTSKHLYEIHNSAQHGSSYCLTLPYSSLDERALKLTRLTRVENIKRLTHEIELKNQITENAQKSSVLLQFDELVLDKIKEKV